MLSSLWTRKQLSLNERQRATSESEGSSKRSVQCSSLKTWRSQLPLQLDHIYITNLRWAFQDDKYLYYVLDLMMGGDLRCKLLRFLQFNHLTKTKDHHDRKWCPGEPAIKIWVAQVTSAIEYLHSKRIIHRYVRKLWSNAQIPTEPTVISRSTISCSIRKATPTSPTSIARPGLKRIVYTLKFAEQDDIWVCRFYIC
jgi:serine/threonine protein kinase